MASKDQSTAPPPGDAAMTEPTPATVREWQLDSDADIRVSVRVVDECYHAPGNTITIRDDQGYGVVNVYLTSVDEFIAAVRAAAAEVSQ